MKINLPAVYLFEDITWETWKKLNELLTKEYISLKKNVCINQTKMFSIQKKNIPIKPLGLPQKGIPKYYQM